MVTPYGTQSMWLLVTPMGIQSSTGTETWSNAGDICLGCGCYFHSEQDTAGSACGLGAAGPPAKALGSQGDRLRPHRTLSLCRPDQGKKASGLWNVVPSGHLPYRLLTKETVNKTQLSVYTEYLLKFNVMVDEALPQPVFAGGPQGCRTAHGPPGTLLPAKAHGGNGVNRSASALATSRDCSRTSKACCCPRRPRGWTGPTDWFWKLPAVLPHRGCAPLESQAAGATAPIHQLHSKSSTAKKAPRNLHYFVYYIVYAWIIEKNRFLD